MSDPIFLIFYYFGYSLINSILKGRLGIEKKRLENLKKKFYYLLFIETLQLIVQIFNTYLIYNTFISIKYKLQLQEHQRLLNSYS